METTFLIEKNRDCSKPEEVEQKTKIPQKKLKKQKIMAQEKNATKNKCKLKSTSRKLLNSLSMYVYSTIKPVNFGQLFI